MKIVERLNFRVVVYPRRRTDSIPSEANERHEAEKLLAQIQSQNIGGKVELIYDTEASCSFCNGEWETSLDGQPQCCDEALNEWVKTPNSP